MRRDDVPSGRATRFDLTAPFTAFYHPARAFLLRRGLYLLLAFDVWLVMIEHGGRYGAGGFNVAHFAWIDALIGVPSPALYVGLLIAAGLLSLTMAFVRTALPERLLLALVYTASWAMSLHDSYQHHYLLSWLLTWCAFIPDPPSRDAIDGSSRPSAVTQAAPNNGAGLTLTAFTCAIVYAFTALSKSSPEWRSGVVLARLSQPSTNRPDGGPLAALRDALSARFFVSGLEVLAWLAASLIALQLVVALAYLCAPGRDGSGCKIRAALSGLGLSAALAFHLGAEVTQIFEIGWFSYYMLWIALVLLSPAAWVSWLARVLLRAFSPLSRVLAGESGGVMRAWLYASALLILFVAAGIGLDLPGAVWACALFALLLLVALWRAAVGGHAGELERWALASVIACAGLWCSVTLTSVRFDFYRRWAGEVSRLGELELALALYRKADEYAPPGTSRATQIEHLERELDRRGRSPVRRSR